MPGDLFLGLDLGTSGARAIVIDSAGEVMAEASSPLADHSDTPRDPTCWLAAAKTALRDVVADIDRPLLRAICVDGTSGTMLPIDAAGQSLSEARMYNDACDDADILARIADLAPAESAAHGATSGAAKALLFQALTPHADKIVHQADWIAGQLCGVYSSDDNNALKSGFDVVARNWPDWMAQAGINRALLPDVQEPGTRLGPVTRKIAAEFDIPDSVALISGTTDGCAAFLATGASEPGDGVTSIGTTLVLKIISEAPIFDPQSGVYSHRLLGNWLAGGASNSGGGVLLDHFTGEEIAQLSGKIDPTTRLGLDYYPLRKPGERFPISDPDLPPQMSPKPDLPEDFLKAMFEGISHVEALAYAKLEALGAPKLTSVRSVGGAAGNEVLTAIRAHDLSVPMRAPTHLQAAYGAAILARHGMDG